MPGIPEYAVRNHYGGVVSRTSKLVSQVRNAAAQGASLGIVGGGTKSPDDLQAFDDVIRMSDHRGVIDYQPKELVLTVKAGTSIAEINAILAENDQMLASGSASFDGRATIGGALACNQSGPARPWLGSPRDHVLGIRLINGNAECLRFGGQVMKNVAGFDIARLQAGAMGIFGAILEVSLRIVPRPALSQTCTIAASFSDGMQRVHQIGRTSAPLTAACWVDENLYLRFSGSELSTAKAISDVRGRLLDDDSAFWTSIGEQSHRFFADARALTRFCAKSTTAISNDTGTWLIDWGGIVRWRSGETSRTELESIAADWNASAQYFVGGRSGEWLSHSLSPPYVILINRLKKAFDPYGIFNRGRVYPWLCPSTQ